MKIYTFVLGLLLAITPVWSATIKTIKPAGGGDYTTLAAWEDWADSQTNADQWAECYTGGNLGAVVIYDWPAITDTNYCPRIYAANGHEHLGYKSTGAYIQMTGGGWPILVSYINYLSISGIRIDGNSVGYNGVECHGSTGIVTIASLYVYDFVYVGLHLQNDASVVVHNCITESSDSYLGIWAENNGDEASIETSQVEIYNHTHWGGYAGIYVSQAIESVVRNCISGNTEDLDFGNDGVEYIASNNLSEDSTADNFGGFGHIVDQVMSDVLADTDVGDLRLKPGSPAIDSGLTLVNVTNDITKLTRPQGIAYDMGAYEYPFAPPELVGWWALDEGLSTNAYDSTTNQHNGILLGSPTWITSGVFSNALQFHGTNYVSIPNAPKLSPPNELTVSAWLKRSVTNDGFVVSKWATNGLSGSYLIWVTPTNSEFNVFLNGTETTVLGTNPVTLSAWHHLTGVYSGSNLALYVDGVLDRSIAASGTVDSVSQALWIGGVPSVVDDVLLYNYALTPSEISDLYEAADTDDDGILDVDDSDDDNDGLPDSIDAQPVVYDTSVISFTVTYPLNGSTIYP